jgi:nicotinate-nucleotide adenylyltransferase
MNARARKALFGGTFDPVHEGHLHIARMAREQLSLDSVIFLPCSISPHKITPSSASIIDRLNMLEIATEDQNGMLVSDFDALQAAPAYSYRTVEYFTTLEPETEWFWIMGYDQWEALPRWQNPEILAKSVTFLVFTRDQAPLPREGYRMKALQGIHPASSSALRERQGPDHLRADWLHPKVLAWIEQQGKYR